MATGTICSEAPAPGLSVDELISDPFGREAAFQAAGLHAMAHKGHMFLPAAVGRTTVYHPAKAGQEVFVRVLEIEGAPEGRASFDAEIWSSDGALLQVGRTSDDRRRATSCRESCGPENTSSGRLTAL